MLRKKDLHTRIQKLERILQKIDEDYQELMHRVEAVENNAKQTIPAEEYGGIPHPEERELTAEEKKYLGIEDNPGSSTSGSREVDEKPPIGDATDGDGAGEEPGSPGLFSPQQTD